MATLRIAVPEELRRLLRTAVELEHIAHGADQRQRAIEASGRLFWAAQLVGWQQVAIADAVDLKAMTVQARIRVARGHMANGVPLLNLPRPRVRPPRRRHWRALPLEERPWLRAAGVRTVLGISSQTLHNYHQAGLLPRTAMDSRNHYRYDTRDVLALRNAPRYNRTGIAYAATRAWLGMTEDGHPPAPTLTR